MRTILFILTVLFVFCTLVKVGGVLQMNAEHFFSLHPPKITESLSKPHVLLRQLYFFFVILGTPFILVLLGRLFGLSQDDYVQDPDY